VILPHALDGFEEPIAFHRSLNGFCPAAEFARTMRAGRSGECGDDAFLCKCIEMFCDELLDTGVQLVAVYEI
jgi:hypothetical protein